MLHERENNQKTETFLKENGKKFSQDCVTAMKLMYQGVRLNGDTCKHLYGISDRRLRDCIAGRPDIVRKEWVVGQDGKRKVVEYFIPPIITPSKAKSIAWATEFLNRQQGELF